MRVLIRVYPPPEAVSEARVPDAQPPKSAGEPVELVDLEPVAGHQFGASAVSALGSEQVAEFTAWGHQSSFRYAKAPTGLVGA